MLMQEAVQGCRVVKTFGMEDYESERFRAMLNKQLRMMRRVLRAGAFSSPFIEVLGACASGGRTVVRHLRSADRVPARPEPSPRSSAPC